MAISLRAAGTATSATAAVTAINPAVPTGATTGDLSVLTVWMKPYGTTITTPSGWTKIGEATNGTTAAGTDTGSTKVAVFVRESASVGAIGNITFGGSPNSCGAVINTYQKASGDVWDYSSWTSGGDSTNGANYSATGAAGISVASGDWVFQGTAVNGDVGTQSARAIGGMSGATLGTYVSRQSADVTTGTDSHGEVGDVPVSSGSSSSAPTFTYTNSSSGSGTTIWLRLRTTTPAATDVIYDNSTNLAESTGNASFTHTPSTAPDGVVVVIAGESNGTTEPTTAVTYGGVSMSKVAHAAITGADSMYAQVWFLGTGISSGAQSVAITSGSGYYYIATCYSVHTDDGQDTEVTDFDEGTITGTSVGTSVTIPSGSDVFMAGALGSDAAATTDVTDGGDLTRSHSNDHGSQVDILNRRTSIYAGTGSAYTGFSWTQSTSQAAAFAVAAIGKPGAQSGTASVTGAGSVSASARQQAGASVAGVGSVTATSSVLVPIGATVRGGGRVGGAPGDDMIIPFYIYPTGGSAWDTIIANPSGIGYIVANDRSGNLAGLSADANYTSYIAAAKAAGIRILYYVDTNYSAVSYATVTANMAAWVSFYGAPDGWFFDRASAASANISYYQSLYTYASGKKVVLNHGTTPDEAYLSTSGTCDISVIAENTAAVIQAWPAWPSWLSNYSADRYCVISHTATNVRDAWGAIPNGIKYKYVTDVYSALPSFYSTEVGLASSLAGGVIQKVIASVAGVGSVSASATQTIRATASVTGAGSVSAVGGLATVQGTASVTGVGSVSASGSIRGSASVTGAGSVSASVRQRAGASVAGVGSVSALARLGAMASVAGVGSVSALARIGATASVAGVGSVSASATQTIRGTASVTGSGSVSASARQAATGSVVGVGSVTAVPSVILRSTASVVGTGATSATGSVIVPGSASVAGVGSVSALARLGAAASVAGVGSVSALARLGAAASVAGVGSVSASATQIIRATASVTGSGSVSATGLPGVRGSASVAGVGSVSASATQIIRGTASVAGVGSVTAVGFSGFGTASVAGVGSVTAIVRLISGATVVGSGSVSATGTVIIYGSATVMGVGSAVAVVTQQVSATVNASGSVTAEAEVIVAMATGRAGARYPAVPRPFAVGGIPVAASRPAQAVTTSGRSPGTPGVTSTPVPKRAEGR